MEDRATSNAEFGSPPGPVLAGCENVRREPREAVRGTILALHGFSAGTWQFEELADRWLAQGYRVLVPRLPGHGALGPDGQVTHEDLPEAAHWARYRTFADEALAWARTWPDPILLCGMSAGGAVALDIATRAPDVTRTCLVAPLLGPAPRAGRVLMGVHRWLEPRTAGAFGRILDRIPYSWGRTPPVHEDGWNRPGHWHMRVGHLASVLTYAARVAADARRPSGPVFLISTAGDDLSAEPPIRDLAGRLELPAEAWHHYPAREGVPHAMIHRRQHPDAARRRDVQERITRFLTGEDPGPGQDPSAAKGSIRPAP